MAKGDLYRSKFFITLPVDETDEHLEVREGEYLLDLGIRHDLGAEQMFRYQTKMLVVYPGKVILAYEDYMSDFEKIENF